MSGIHVVKVGWRDKGMRAFYFYIAQPNGERKYFSDCETKQANEFAQAQADATGKTVVRYDVDGGQSWFYASETTADGYRIYAGS